MRPTQTGHDKNAGIDHVPSAQADGASDASQNIHLLFSERRKYYDKKLFEKKTCRRGPSDGCPQGRTFHPLTGSARTGIPTVDSLPAVSQPAFFGNGYVCRGSGPNGGDTGGTD